MNHLSFDSPLTGESVTFNIISDEPQSYSASLKFKILFLNVQVILFLMIFLQFLILKVPYLPILPKLVYLIWLTYLLKMLIL